MQVFGSASRQKTLRNCSPLEELFRLEKENTLPCQDLGISIKSEVAKLQQIHLILKSLGGRIFNGRSAPAGDL